MSRVWDFHPQEKPDLILGMDVIFVDEKVRYEVNKSFFSYKYV